VITDAWDGIEMFFEPGAEILLAENAEDVVHYLRVVSREDARHIGACMRRRALRDHTYELRARKFDSIVAGRDTAQRAA
jgi:spore maturation protein CgeB